MALAKGYNIEPVYGHAVQIAGQLVRFWVDNGALNEAAARQRVNHVACILRNENGEIRGVSSVVAVAMPMLGNRSVWMYNNYLPEPERSDDNFIEMFNNTREAMQALLEQRGIENVPTGICVILQDKILPRRYPKAAWLETGLVYAGHTPQGFQVRIAWLDEPGGWANVDRKLDKGFRIETVWRNVTPEIGEEIIALWLNEHAMPENIARQRITEVAQIVRDSGDAVAGICTLYREHNIRLRMPLWYIRAFIGSKYRRSSIGFCLLHSTVDYMQDLYDRGEDQRAQGIFMEVENESLRRMAPQGLWGYRRFAYIGNNARGEHMRVQYFNGAELSSDIL